MIFSTDIETDVSTTDVVAPREIPMYNVVLIDDDEHTYDYVIEMLCKLFRFKVEQAYESACLVDRDGRVIVETCMLEQAELKRDQIHAFGPDFRITRCKGSMTAIIEPTVGG
ncbi:MAG: ATP-dependent Clp protease adaptor ClpS [Phycisphaerae bacterium]